jgi:hypothetical protein
MGIRSFIATRETVIPVLRSGYFFALRRKISCLNCKRKKPFRELSQQDKSFKKGYFFAPVWVIFFAGLMGLGGFVCEGSSSPWGWEWGVCFFGSAGFFIGLCSG